MKETKKQPILSVNHYLLGVRFDNYLRLLARARFNIKPSKIPQATFIGLLSLVLAPFALIEGAVCAIPIARTKIRKDPVFILGHWRSGTTYLQNLMSRDPQFGWAKPTQTAMFSNCALLGWALKGGVQKGIKGSRPMDNVQYDLNLPMEETFAIGNFTPYTLDHLLAFPIVWEKYVDCAFVDELPKKDRDAFKRAYQYAMKKLTMLWKGKQLILKSPDNTARIGCMLEMYPDAKFVNIYRDPYDTVRSSVNMILSQVNLVHLTPLPDTDLRELLEDMVVERTFDMYKDLFAREKTFKPGHYVSIKYEDFVQEPERYLREIYEVLELDGFEAALPHFRAFIAEQKDYQTNKKTMSPRLREKINKHLGFYFEHYGYEMITGEEMVTEG